VKGLRLWFLVVAALASSSNIMAENAAGVWRGEITLSGQHRDVTLTLSINGSGLTGSMTAEGYTDTAELLDGTVNGTDVSFFIESGADDVPRFEFRGAITGDELKLTIHGQVKTTGANLTLGEGALKRSK
jgi:hypothetical protein